MYRLIRLTLGWVLAIYGFGLIAGGDTLAPYRLRDGLIVATLGALLFAWNGLRPAVRPPVPAHRLWPFAGRLLLLTGLACGIAASLLLTFVGATGWWSALGGSLWLLGCVALLVGVFWPGRVEIYPAPFFRWRVDAAGNWVRMALGDAATPTDAAGTVAGTGEHAPSHQRAPIYALLIGLILLIGIGLRLWRLTTLPPTCIDAECARALQLVEGAVPAGFTSANAGLHTWLSRLLWGITGDGVAALRWASVILGSLFLPAWAWAARAAIRPAGVVIGLMGMALLPWAIWTSRFGSEWSAAPLLLALVVGLALRALARQDRRWWGLTGAAVGLLWIQPLGLQGVILLWLLLMMGLAWWQGGHAPGDGVTARFGAVGVLAAAALTVGLPLALPALLAQWPRDAAGSLDQLARLAALLHSGGGGIAYFLHNPLLPAAAAALAWCGWAILLRWVYRPPVALLLGGTLVFAAGSLWLFPLHLSAAPGVAAVGGFATPPAAAQTWLALLPFVGWGLALAADQLALAFDLAWARVVTLPRVLTAAALVLLLLLGRQALQLTTQLDIAGGGAQDAAQIAMTQYLADCLRNPSDDPCSQSGEDAPIFFAPPAVVNHPATQLLMGDALRDGRIRVLDTGRDLIPAMTPPGDLIFLVALDNTPVIDLMQQLYPNASLQAQPRDQAGPTQFLVMQIQREDILAHQGVLGRYDAGTARGGANTAESDLLDTRQEGPLAFGWAGNPPVEGPFHVVWEGTLLVPAAGRYTFSVESAPVGAPPVISLQLDNNIVLDTSLGLTEQQIMLPQGYARFVLRYRTEDAPDDWAVRWTLPGGGEAQPVPIPRHALYSPSLPNIGLLGTYYAGTSPEGPALTTRKDLILTGEADLPLPYSVRWEGNVAAARAGEYLFAVTANGPVNLVLDGEVVLAHLPPSQLGQGPGFSQASIYLAQGWHELEMTYVPQGRADLRLLWQPPGSTPSLLLSRQLLPVTGQALALDYPLPAAPELVDARLGDAQFALTANMEFAQPGRVLPPNNLPRLLAEPVWDTANGCGAGADQLDSPRGVALDAAAGRVYVADANNRRVVVLDLATGDALESLDIEGLQEPVDVALAPDGTLLVLDTLIPAIYRVDLATGETAPLALTTGFYRPRGLAVDAVGNIAVADTGGARVVLLDAQGAQLAEFGGPQSILGQGQPVDTLALNGVWWAVAADNGRLWRLDVLGSLPALARANTITGPHLAALADGGFFLSSPAQRTVIYLAPSGQPLSHLVYPERLVNPTGVAAATHSDNPALVDLVIADAATCGVSLWRLRPQ